MIILTTKVFIWPVLTSTPFAWIFTDKFLSNSLYDVYYLVRENEKTKIGDGEEAVLECDGKQKINFRKIHFPPNKCSKTVSLNSIRKRCNGQRTCNIKLKDLTKLNGQPKTCIEGQIGSTSLKFHCQDRKIFSLCNIFYVI